MKRKCLECGNQSVVVKPLFLVGTLSCGKCIARYEYRKGTKGMLKFLLGLIPLVTIYVAFMSMNENTTVIMFLLILLGVGIADFCFSGYSKLSLVGVKAIRKRLRNRRK